MRPWKAEQLGGGYRVSSWAERTAYESAAAVVAVSAGMREDILKSYPSLDPARVHVVHNGIDSQLWSADRSAEATEIVRRHGVDPDKRSVVFVGRITRQKGLPYLLRACAQLPPDVQLVLCAGAPDTPEILAEVEGLMNELRVAARGRRLDPRHAAARRGRRAAEPRHRLRLPVGLRAARHRQPRGDGVRARRSSPRPPAASPRSSSTARRAGSCRSSRCRTARARRSTRSASSPTSLPRSTRQCPTSTAPPPSAGRSHAGCRLVLVGLHRRPHARGLPGGPRRLSSLRRSAGAGSADEAGPSPHTARRRRRRGRPGSCRAGRRASGSRARAPRGARRAPRARRRRRRSGPRRRRSASARGRRR